VLKYRLGIDGYHHPAMLHDAARALRSCAPRAAEWQLDPKRIGIVGSSAGGHLASTLMTHFDAGNAGAMDVVERQSSRPDLAILCYPGDHDGPVHSSGIQKQFARHEPAAGTGAGPFQRTTRHEGCAAVFRVTTGDDEIVPVENSLQFADALRHAGVPFELHVYQHGKHGLGLGARDEEPAKWHPWTGECVRWLKEQGYAK